MTIVEAAPAAIGEALSSKAINRKIGEIRRSGTALNNAIHTTACMIISHAQDYGDCTGAARLLAALPKSHRRSLVQTWFTRYSPINVGITKDGKAKAHLRKPDNNAFNAFNPEGAKANPFYAMPEAEKEPDLFTIEDFEQSIISFVKRMEKRLADGKVAEADREAFAHKIEAVKAIKAQAA